MDNHRKKYIKFLRQKLIGERRLSQSLITKLNAQETKIQCKICISDTLTLMTCGACEFPTCEQCHLKRSNDICFFCNTETFFVKCRLD